MELDEEELIEQEFDNICNKIFSINSLIINAIVVALSEFI